jgi:MYXO-CTERM domain-containing protein
MKHLLLKNAAVALVVAAVAAPLAGAGTSYDGHKSGYPQLHAILSGHIPVAATPPESGMFYGGYKSGYPELHATLSAHITSVPSRVFSWRDASAGAGTAAGLIALLAVGALLFVRRRHPALHPSWVNGGVQ